MRILRGLASYPPDLRPCVTALGAFDGIHLGHALLITTAVERSRALGLPAVVCTFDPHPANVLWPERAPLPIATLEDNLGRMDGLGADAAMLKQGRDVIHDSRRVDHLLDDAPVLQRSIALRNRLRTWSGSFVRTRPSSTALNSASRIATLIVLAA